MSLKLNSSGGGSVTVQEPTTASNVTLNLPAADGTVVYADGSGNVGIGTSSPNSKLNTYAAANALSIQYVATNQNAVSPTAAIGFNVSDSSETTAACAKGGIGFTRNAAFGGGYLAFYNNNSGAAGNFTTADERARIDSSGRFLVNTTGVSSAGRAQIVQTDQGNAGLSVDATNASFDYNVLFLNTTRAASSAFDYIQCDSGGYAAAQFRVRGDGVIFAQNTTVQSISDARTKENVRDANEGLDTILGLRPVRFDFKEGFGNNRKNQLGFIAQEVEPIFPDAVDVAGELDENGEPYKSVGPSAMIPVLVKAIQEQQQMIETLQAKVAALEAK